MYVINKYKTKLYEYLQLTDTEPVVREDINNRFIEIVFHTDAKNIFASFVAMSVLYLTLMFFEVNWYLHVWLFFVYAYYFVRYAILQLSIKGKFLGVKKEIKRLTDIQVAIHGSILGGCISALYLIISSPPYPVISESIIVMALLIYLTAALSINSNLPIWCFSFTTFLIVPMVLIMLLKGGVYIMTGIIVGYYGFFIFSMNLRYYKLYYNSYLFQYQNKKYLEQAHDSRKKLEEFVKVLQRKNRELTQENRLRKQAEKKIQLIASVDALTGVTNRVSLEDKMNRAIRQAKRTQTNVGIIFIDFDEFKLINDNFGHHVGDELLRSVVHRLNGCVRETDEIFRIGGDEFIILITNIQRQESMRLVAQKILHVLEQPHLIEEKSIISRVSMGISIYPQNSNNSDDLLKFADRAMYKSKEDGGNTYTFYSQ